jgi:hypothetical protein
MIVRVFRPTIHPGKEPEFEAFLRDTAIPLVLQQAGLVAQHVGRPRDPSSTEYLYVTVWEDVESIRAFAGERWQEAVITLTRSTSSRTPGSGTTRSSLHPARSIARAHHDGSARVLVASPGRPGYWLCVVLVVVAVAHRRFGPNSSATTSTVDRALPSSAVQVRCCSRPTTTTRLPFERDSAACSAWSRHTITVKNDGSCSLRPETATRKDARAMPLSV